MGGLTGRILAALSVVTGCIAAEAIRADYSSYGILLMAIYYLLRERKLPRLLAGSALAFLESLYMTLGLRPCRLSPCTVITESGERRIGSTCFTGFIRPICCCSLPCAVLPWEFLCNSSGGGRFRHISHRMDIRCILTGCSARKMRRLNCYIPPGWRCRSPLRYIYI